MKLKPKVSINNFMFSAFQAFIWLCNNFSPNKILTKKLLDSECNGIILFSTTNPKILRKEERTQSISSLEIPKESILFLIFINATPRKPSKFLLKTSMLLKTPPASNWNHLSVPKSKTLLIINGGTLESPKFERAFAISCGIGNPKP